MDHTSIFMTGATGLLGQRVLTRLLRDDPHVTVHVLLRDRAGFEAAIGHLGRESRRVRVLEGDVRHRDLGLDRRVLRSLSGSAGRIVHLAADIVFSRSLAEARATNTAGTLNLLAATRGWSAGFCYVSTAFVAGRRTGLIREGDTSADAGWVNAYEQSKWEAERVVREAGREFLILRPSTIVCDSTEGTVSQYNAVHRALRLLHGGLAPMLPGDLDAPVDVVPADFVADSIARLATREDLLGRTFHLCAGRGAATLGDLLDLTFAIWSEDPTWRRRGIARPLLTDLETYGIFEQGVDETGDPRLREVARSLSHFVPQLALGKRFDTAAADAVLGMRAPPVRDYWPNIVRGLVRGHWGRSPARIAA
jgi:nucleoside-diphosphate-sugar epimerase